MEIIMLADVHKVGHKDQIVDVRSGYANNYLIPNGLAEVANDMNRKKLAEKVKQTLHKEKQTRKKAQATAEEIEALNLVIAVRADENGKIFGAITAVQIALALQQQNFNIEPRQISHSAHIKEIGTYQTTIQIYKDVEATLNFELKASE